jgi:hypothetical protein
LWNTPLPLFRCQQWRWGWRRHGRSCGEKRIGGVGGGGARVWGFVLHVLRAGQS